MLLFSENLFLFILVNYPSFLPTELVFLLDDHGFKPDRSYIIFFSFFLTRNPIEFETVPELIIYVRLVLVLHRVVNWRPVLKNR